MWQIFWKQNKLCNRVYLVAFFMNIRTLYSSFLPPVNFLLKGFFCSWLVQDKTFGEIFFLAFLRIHRIICILWQTQNDNKNSSSFWGEIFYACIARFPPLFLSFEQKLIHTSTLGLLTDSLIFLHNAHKAYTSTLG